LWLAGNGSDTRRVTDQIDRDGFRANVGIVLMHDDGQVFLGRRVGGRGWQFPQGGVQQGEALEQAMYRELREEIGLREADVAVAGATTRWLRYRLPARYVRREQQPLCIGQKQRWFLLRLRSPDALFRFDQTDQPEFDGWRWTTFWEPVREVVHFKRQVYRKALHELGAQAFPAGLPAYPEWWTATGGAAGASRTPSRALVAST
jgi:putative (di)nucleoside polyphosphate hydrolase